MTLMRPSLRLFFCFISCSSAVSFYFTSTPTQCANIAVQWIGGQGPFTLLLVPVGHLNPETRTIIQRDIPSGNSVAFTLDFPAQSQFVAILNDASGIGAGGTSAITTVASSSDSSCLSKTQSHPKFFLFLPDDIGQCNSIDISWSSEAQPPIDISGVIPGGESFEIANVTDSSTHFQWTADVRSGTQIMFVAGDKDGLGTGGSSDVMQISEGNRDTCINDSSPSSTSGPAAGGIFSTAQGQDGTRFSGSDVGSTIVVTTDNVGSTVTVGGTVTTDEHGSSYTIAGSMGAGPITTTDNAGSIVTIKPTSPITSTDNSGSAVTIGGGGSTGPNGHDLPTSEVPGSSGGTVTGSSNGSSSSDKDNLGLILGILFGLLALGLILSGIVVHRRRRWGNAYRNLETGRSVSTRQHPWVTALTRSSPVRRGAGSSVDTLPSMYQTEPFILPSEHEPYYMPPHEPSPAQRQRPDLAARASSSLSLQTLLGGPFTPDAFGGTLAGMHGPDRKDNTSTHTQTTRILSNNLLTRVMRDHEDFSPEPEETSANPFDDSVIEIPPTYASVRRASRSNDREPWQPARSQLERSNASRRTREAM